MLPVVDVRSGPAHSSSPLSSCPPCCLQRAHAFHASNHGQVPRVLLKGHLLQAALQGPPLCSTGALGLIPHPGGCCGCQSPTGGRGQCPEPPSPQNCRAPAPGPARFNEASGRKALHTAGMQPVIPCPAQPLKGPWTSLLGLSRTQFPHLKGWGAYRGHLTGPRGLMRSHLSTGVSSCWPRCPQDLGHSSERARHPHARQSGALSEEQGARSGL